MASLCANNYYGRANDYISNVRSFINPTLGLYNTMALACSEDDPTNLLPDILGGLLWNFSLLD